MPELASSSPGTAIPDAMPAAATVVLVNMPFGGYRQPSLALGLLKAALAPVGVRVLVLDATLTFAAAISPATYETIATWRAEDLLGDWVFSRWLPAPPTTADQEYFEQVLAGGAPEHRVPYFGKPPLTAGLRAQLADACVRAGELLDALLEEILRADPLVVGFTSMFHQQTASLALAARVKAAAPRTCTVFGGAACRGEMGAELLRSFPFVDAVATAEGEHVLPELVRRRLQGAPITGIAGLLTSAAAAAPPEHPEHPPAVDLDALPAADFTDYFERLFVGPLKGAFVPRLPFETSRGCWWGEKSRCTFCGQASAAMTYRHKSPQRTLAELEELTSRYPGCPVMVTDEILPPAFLDELLPTLHERLPELEVVYFEVRPELPRESLELLAEAGIRRLEAGIETLSTPLLKRMRKGTSALQNVRFLKWAREIGVQVVWNLLWGLPGEDRQDYDRMAALIPLLTHLQPPNAVGSFRLDRFSPIFEQPDRYGVENLRPYPSAAYVFGLPTSSLTQLVSSFAFDYRVPQPVELYTTPLAEQVAAWKEAWPHSVLACADHGDRLVIYDRRPGFDEEELTALDGVHRALYLACDDAQTVPTLAEKLSSDLGTPISAGDVEAAGRELVAAGLMLNEGTRYLSLALRMPQRPDETAREAAGRAESQDRSR